MNYADIIKSQITMTDVLNKYGFETNSKHRIACPLHNGKDKNFAYTDKSWKCFSQCCDNGDVIKFVMVLFNIDFISALNRLNYDFYLGLKFGNRLTIRECQKLALEERKRKADKDAEIHKKNLLNANLVNAMEQYDKSEADIELYKPKSPFEDINPNFTNAIKNISLYDFLVEQAQIEIYKNERRVLSE